MASMLAAASWLATTVALAQEPAPAAQAAQQPDRFSFDTVRARARELAAKDYVAPRVDDLPEWLAKLDYDGYRQIRFRPETALWGGEHLPFRVQFAHRGYLYRARVPIHVVDGAEVRELHFARQQFDYGKHDAGAVPENLGYAGLAVRFPLPTTADGGGDDASDGSNSTDGDGVTRGEPTFDEVASFLGASYYRLLGRDQIYGASLRGLAIDTASENGEEFPAFVELWLEKPLPGATSITIHALLDSPSTAGAYRFVITPGAATRAAVTACLFPRHRVAKLGIAPLTSMFVQGEARLRAIADYRPEVHDSDGRLAATADGTWLWRPLANPTKSHRITRLPLPDPAGFGLLQRDRSFASYEDLEGRFEQRPSYWVEPRGRWGKGALELIEIPTLAEWNDNIVAFWVPEQAPDRGEELRLEYDLFAYLEHPARPPLARVRSTRVRIGEKSQLFVIDFVGPQLADPTPSPARSSSTAGSAPPAASGPAASPPAAASRGAIHAGAADDGGGVADLHADVAVSRGKVQHSVLQPNVATGGQRCSFELLAAGEEPVEIRVTLRRGERVVSETLVLHWVAP